MCQETFWHFISEQSQDSTSLNNEVLLLFTIAIFEYDRGAINEPQSWKLLNNLNKKVDLFKCEKLIQKMCNITHVLSQCACCWALCMLCCNETVIIDEDKTLCIIHLHKVKKNDGIIISQAWALRSRSYFSSVFVMLISTALCCNLNDEFNIVMVSSTNT